MNSVLQYVFYLAVLVVLAIPLGAYMKKVRNGGNITVSDNRPHGTVFTLTLPVEEVTLHE